MSERPTPILSETQAEILWSQEQGETPLPTGAQAIIDAARATFTSPWRLRWEAAAHNPLAKALLDWETRNDQKEEGE